MSKPKHSSLPASAPVAGEAVAYRVGTDLFLLEALPAAERYAEIRQKPLEPLYAAPQASEAQCSCPSGDGSLRHPCAVHPASEAVDLLRKAAEALAGYRREMSLLQAWDEQPCDAEKAILAALSAQPGAQKDEPTSD